VSEEVVLTCLGSSGFLVMFSLVGWSYLCFSWFL